MEPAGLGKEEKRPKQTNLDWAVGREGMFRLQRSVTCRVVCTWRAAARTSMMTFCNWLLTADGRNIEIGAIMKLFLTAMADVFK